jgi:hypothetical protein
MEKLSTTKNTTDGLLTMEVNRTRNSILRINEKLLIIKSMLNRVSNDLEEEKVATGKNPSLEPVTLHEKMIMNSESIELIEEKIQHLIERIENVI